MPVAPPVKSWLARIAKFVVPQWYWRRHYNILRRLGENNPDTLLVRSLCDPNRISVDIGADVGEFTIAMLAASQSVIAFEPRPRQARELTAMFEAVGAAVRVEAVALSDRPGVRTMRMLDCDPGRSTIDERNPLDDADDSPTRTLNVHVKRLDDVHLDNVGLLKIDVEGHELAVLHGAVDTLSRNQPTIVIEAEERHHPRAVAEITEFFTGLGYTGYFIMDDQRQPIEKFDPAQHQNPANIAGWKDGWEVRGVYINNFIFLPIHG